MKKIIINEEYQNRRLDKSLADILLLSREKIQSLISENKILVNSKSAKPSYKLELNDEIEVIDLSIKDNSTLIPEKNIDLDIVYEDDDILVINKPKGLVVHPGNGNYTGTIANALKGRYEELSDLNGDIRPGIVHRIDKDTSGLLVVAKNNFAHEYLSSLLKDHNIKRTYIALVKGEIKENKGKIIAPIGRDKNIPTKMSVDLVKGKEAITHFEVINRYKGYTLIKCELETGRTHQIRVHLDYIGYPIVGDNRYGKNNLDLYNKGQLLHAYKLSFIHPRTKKEVSFEAPLPKYFLDVLDKLSLKK